MPAQAPFEGRANRQLADRLLEACLGDPALAEHMRQITGAVVTRRQLRTRSKLQQVVHSAVRSGLMRRDSKGRFTRLDPRLKAKINRIKLRNIKTGKPSKAEIRQLERETFALLTEA